MLDVNTSLVETLPPRNYIYGHSGVTERWTRPVNFFNRKTTGLYDLIEDLYSYLLTSNHFSHRFIIIYKLW